MDTTEWELGVIVTVGSFRAVKLQKILLIIHQLGKRYVKYRTYERTGNTTLVVFPVLFVVYVWQVFLLLLHLQKKSIGL
jgi:hypothetical protein